MEARTPLAQELSALLISHGYVGAATSHVPLTAVLLPALKALAEAPSFEAQQLGVSGIRWNAALPPDFKRAGPEIYSKLRAQGAGNIREWLQMNFTGNKESSQFTDLWHAATTVDFRIAEAEANGTPAMSFLHRDDGCEIALRRMGAYVYEKRTGDRRGAQQMLAVATPGAQTDISPGWLVADATLHSKTEHQRDECVKADRKTDYQPKGKGKDKAGKGKDKGKKGKPGAKAGAKKEE